MALTTITARVDQKDKADFDAFCSNVGLNTSTAINLFVKAVLREKRIPFEIAPESGPFLLRGEHGLCEKIRSGTA